MSQKKTDNKTQILGVNITSTNLTEVLTFLKEVLAQKRSKLPFLITTPNSEQIVIAQTNDTFRSILNGSELSLPDGAGLVIASRLLAITHNQAPIIRHRISGIDVMEKLCFLAAQKGYKVFLLGGRGNVAELAVQKLRQKYPNLKINSFSGAKDISQETRDELGESLARINSFQTDILFVGYGAPYQEKWLWNHRDKLRLKIAMTVGGAFDVISGNIPRAPWIMRRIGLEWLWRLTHEPWRWKRQLRLLKFTWLVVTETLTA